MVSTIAKLLKIRGYKKVLMFNMCIILTVMIVLSLNGKANAEQKELNIGILLTLSGFGGSWGIPMAAALEMEADKINSEGGIKIGGEKYLIKLFKEDTEFSPEKSHTGARALVERDKVKVIFGPIVTHTTLAVLPITTPAKVINIAPCWSNEVLLKKTNAPYIFKGVASPPELLPGLWQYITSTYPKVKRVAELTPNTMSGKYGTQISKDILPKVGLELVAEEYIEPTVKNFIPILTRILTKKPDVIHSTGLDPSSWALTMKQVREMGYKGLFVQEAAMSADFLSIAGKNAANGYVHIEYPTYGPLSTQGYQDFRARYNKRYGKWNPLAPNLVQTFYPILEAYQIAGTIDNPDLVVKILESKKLNIFGLEGSFGGSKKLYDLPHQWLSPVYIMEVKGGKNTIVGEISVEDQNLYQ